ncbi:MAG: type II toxin-antitoxin system ParD family antitoxin [Psychrosphaera sp.]|nr:type II toxin-antitoxin system ParD family antitoxin [Psychrosphaera sp.]
MPTMNISLPEPMRAWVQAQIDDGKYAGNSDYVRDLIRKDQEQKNKIEAMQAAITKGLESGTPQDFDKEAFKKRMLGSLVNDGL